MTRQPSERNRTAVLLEEIRGQYQVLAEGLSLLNAKVDRLEQQMEARFAVMETALLTLSAEMREGRTRFEQQFQRMDVRLETIDHRLIVHEQLHHN